MGSITLAEWILILGALPMVLAGAVTAGVVGADLSRWLALPAAVLALVLFVGLFEASLPAGGVLEAAFYAGVVFLLSGGFDRPDPLTSWLLSGGAALVFLGAARAVWRRAHRRWT